MICKFFNIIIYSITLFVFGFDIMNLNTVCNVLSLSGGGSYGAIEIGILDSIQKLNHYDIITGVSVGALNAGLLSYYNRDNLIDGISELKNIYSNMKTEDIYNHDFIDFTNKWAFYSTDAMRKTLYNIINNLTITNKYSDGITFIGATNLNSSLLDIFDFNKLNKSDQIEVLMASTAIPIIFPPNKINSSLYVDGGVISNQILIGLGSKVKCEFYNITYITSYNSINDIEKINHLTDYISRLFNIVFNTFDNQISLLKSIKCINPIGKVHYYYSNYSYFSNYSILDMNHGKDLINIGSKYNYLDIFDYCI